MRVIAILSSFLLLGVAARAEAQTPSVSVQAGGGLTLFDTGHNFSAGIAFSPLSRVTLMVEANRAHLNSRVTHTHEPGGRLVGTSAFRGGTMTAVTGTLRLSLFEEGHWTPYVLAGVGKGISRPNVNEQFPTPVTNDVEFALAGGGVSIPLREHLSLFGDARFMLGSSENNGLVAVAPVRVGVSWRF